MREETQNLNKTKLKKLETMQLLRRSDGLKNDIIFDIVSVESDLSKFCIFIFLILAMLVKVYFGC